ncbi:hypothetical protein BS47DRAFT_999170 [Hydnum rufescens UP504]|uniref:Mediator of RNA polymerase II transcription subunit 6 n=1 Tax=Hydnum rufescens UP504 TaxID=1448309 RepID=A0A9P6B9A3_9AGAM|nr:hypothetical protein BS47DRAFT_999170 [Hydnum rufescens UP504]
MATPADDHSEQSFFFPEFIKAMAPLDSRMALEYFTYSPWYRTEPPSNNQILRMQNTGMDVVQIDEVEELRKFTGIEFAVVHDQAPSFFVIQKRERISPNEGPMEAYYIINNRIQQSPDLYSLLCNRLNASLHNLTSSMSTLRTHRPTYTPTKGHVWPVAFDPTSAFISSKKPSGVAAEDAPIDSETPAGGGTPATMRGGSIQPPNRSTARSDDIPTQVQFTIPLLHAIRTTAAHMNAISPYPPTTQAGGQRANTKCHGDCT